MRAMLEWPDWEGGDTTRIFAWKRFPKKPYCANASRATGTRYGEQLT